MSSVVKSFKHKSFTGEPANNEDGINHYEYGVAEPLRKEELAACKTVDEVLAWYWRWGQRSIEAMQRCYQLGRESNG